MVLHEFPDGAAQCVDSETGLVAAGSGSTVLLLNEEMGQLTRLLDGQGAKIELRPRGWVTALRLTPERLYVGAGRRGVLPYERSTWTESVSGLLELPTFGSVGPYERVASLEVVPLPSGGDLVVVGTDGDDIDGVGCSDPLNPACNDGQRPGRLLVFDTSLPPGLQLVGQYDTGKAIDALEVRSDLYAGQVTILVATACGGLAAFHVSKTSPSLPLPIVFTQPSLAGSYPRDLALHTNPSGQTRLYLASYAEQVRAFTVSLGAGPQNLSLSEVIGAGWPLAFSSPISAGKADYPTSLDVDASGTRLAVGYSVRYAEERQFSPGCPTAVLCNGASSIAEQQHLGVWVYDVASFGQAPSLVVSAQEATSIPGHKIRGHGVSFRESTSTSITLDVAGQTEGIGAFSFQAGETGFSLQSHSWWDQDDNLPLPSNDALWLQDGVLYSGTESQVAPYELNSPSGPLSVPGIPGTSYGSSVGVTGFPAPDPRIYGIGTTGFSIFQVSGSNPVRMLPAADRVEVGGNVRLGKAMTGLQIEGGGLSQVYPPARWLVLPLIAKERGGVSFSDDGSLQVWNVGYATEPTDPAIALLEEYTWDSGTCSECSMRFFDVDVRPISLSSAYLYASAVQGVKQLIPGTNPPEYLVRTKPGLFRIRVTGVYGNPGTDVVFSDPQFTPLGPEVYSGGFQVWRVHCDPGSDLIYGAFACAGFAVFSDPNPQVGVAPVLVGRRTGLPGPAFEALPGPGNSLYVSLLEAGVGVLQDRLQPAASDFDVYPTRVSAIGLVVDPLTPYRLYVADTLGGLLHLEFPTSAFGAP